VLKYKLPIEELCFLIGLPRMSEWVALLRGQAASFCFRIFGLKVLSARIVFLTKLPKMG
jgi:hypothetical protein